MVHYSFLAIIFFLCVASSYSIPVVDVQAICKQTENPSFCLAILKSKPGGAGKDLVDLASYTIGVVLRTNLSNTVNLITKLIAQSGGDPKKQSYYKGCLDFFGEERGALGVIDEALQQLKGSDYMGVNVHMSAVLTDVDDCLTNDGDTPVKDPSLLPKYADVVEKVAKINLIISNILRQK